MEEGLFRRAARLGHALPVKISEHSLPMRRSPDDDAANFDIVQWPFLEPWDFAPCML